MHQTKDHLVWLSSAGVVASVKRRDDLMLLHEVRIYRNSSLAGDGELLPVPTYMIW